ncbi:protein NDUFAF4 homolog [Amphibalanus amphitrite]|uniref:protein NDUFAF4 homolog n=1 Tax=Amphibalanus amphitrite TaxID=1232801 RepID=UPI001C923C11|nr:protein NDUFAF4 homolog [Amphibalanus amphitrite]XP_043238613.1 protein NDUFAF4 homolog [Amphibalanus amphitrite]XP_043238614.1 protein NDUFAF4 homolog [Amphibalanus amphitrite]
MGKVYSHVAWRISRNLNVENRAQKIITQEKIRPPPKYKANEEFLSKLREERPELATELEKKDTELLKRLENVYVTSKEPPDMPVQRERAANLPVDRTPPELPTFGYTEPERVPYGRATLRTVVGFVSAHAERPDQVTPASIAATHKLDERVVEDILKHFKMMQMHAPQSETGQIEELDWTSKDPLSEVEFLQAQESGKRHISFPKLDKPRDSPTPAGPTGGPASPAG